MCDLQSEPQLPFRVGDVVEAFGVKGEVVALDGYDCPVRVVFNTGHLYYYRADGKAELWHLEPSLKLVSRPKKKVTKQVEAYVQVDKKGIAYKLTSPGIFHYTGDKSSVSRHQIVKLTGSYETEEE